jgi:GrpB-like predicted nucleotidyltransferase (UPF0157 family)
MRLIPPEGYQSRAADLFEALAQVLRHAVPAARVEHVGASSIPGAISRGDLDVCAIVPATHFDRACAAIKQLGYVEKPDTLRTSELCMLIPADPDEDHAIQLIQAGSEFEFFVSFRDALRADPELVRNYNQVKRESAALGEAAYRAAKSSFIRSVLEANPPVEATSCGGPQTAPQLER